MTPNNGRTKLRRPLVCLLGLHKPREIGGRWVCSGCPSECDEAGRWVPRRAEPVREARLSGLARLACGHVEMPEPDEHGYAICRACHAAVPVALTGYIVDRAHEAMLHRG